jgi:hypothetical protein
MKKHLCQLAGAHEPQIPDSTEAYLRDQQPHIRAALARAGMLESEALKLLSSETNDRFDYGGFMKAVLHRAREMEVPGNLGNYFIANNVPLPNVLTSVYDELGVSNFRRRHARAMGNTAVSSMYLATDFNGPRSDAVSLSYVRHGAESVYPEARLTLFEGDPTVILQGYGALRGAVDIQEVPGVSRALKADVLFAARSILVRDEPR